MGVRSTFNAFHPWIRVVLISSFTLGILLLAGFALTDVGIDLTLWGWDPKPSWLKQFNAEWFHSHAYVPNIYAAITGFLIGAPVALVVLAAFTVQREQQAALDRVNRLSQLAWYDFYAAVTDFATQERLEAVHDDAEEVEKLHDWAYTVISDYVSHIRHRHQGEYVEPTGKLNAIQTVAPKFRDASHNVLRKAKDSGTVELEWAKVVGAWNTLNQYVRLQRLEQDLEWFDAETDARLRMWMARSKNPLQEFTDVHGFTYEAERSPLTMQDAAEAAYIYAGLPDLELRGFFSMGKFTFGVKRVNGYARVRKEAANFLISLQGAVSMVEAANWPESADRPVHLDGNQLPRARLRQLGSARSSEEFTKVARELEEENQATTPETKQD